MKIAFMTSGTINSSISYRPLALAKELVKNGHHAYIFAPRFDKYSNFEDKKIFSIDGVTIVRPLQIRLFSFDFSLFSYILSSTILLLKLRPQIIHIYKPNPVTLSCLVPHFLLKTPFIFDTDDIDSEVMKIEQNSLIKVKLVQWCEKIAPRFASGIIVGSTYLVNFYSFFSSKKIVSYVPNGAEFKNSQYISTKNISSKRIIFIGALNRKNILEPLFHASQRLIKKDKTIKIVIIGDGRYYFYFTQLAKKLGIHKNIIFSGWVSQDDIKKHVQIGDIGYAYMPNEDTIKACSSMKVFQYMQYGAVPLVSNVGEFPKYVFQGKAGVIAKHSNVDALANELEDLLVQQKKRKEMIEFAKNNVKQKYSWSILAKQIEGVYKKII